MRALLALLIALGLSGPAAAWGTIALASEAYANHVNAQGSIHGRKLQIVLKDDGYNPGRAVANFNEMKDSVFAVIGTVPEGFRHRDGRFADLLIMHRRL